MEIQKISNPLATKNAGASAVKASAAASSDEARAVQEVQAAMVIAKRFPRDPIAAMDSVLHACTRLTLANVALYQYSRGGTAISGPSIRLAEAIAQGWGNISFGIRELSSNNGMSVVEAFAWDLETNTKQIKVFNVPHRRHTRKGGYDLTDPRDIYEAVANNGARRLRACLLGVIPGDVVEAAVTQCEETLRAGGTVSKAAIEAMIDKFEAEHGVSRKQIEQRIQCRVEAIRPAQVLSMRKIYNSLNDGMSSVEDWFEPVDNQADEVVKKIAKKTQGKSPIEAFRAEIDAIDNHIHLDRWRQKHHKRIVSELNKSDVDDVVNYAQERYATLKSEAKKK